LLLRALGMRVGSSPARWQQLMMDAEPREAKDATEWRAYAEQLVAAGVMGVIALLNLAVVLDECRTRSSLAHGTSILLIICHSCLRHVMAVGATSDKHAAGLTSRWRRSCS